MATTPARAAEKWGRNLKASTPDIRAGVEGVTESPMEKAANAQDKWLNGVQEAHSTGKFASRLRDVPLSVWKNNTLNKGIGRIAAGVDAAEDKVESFFTELLPYQERLQSQVDGMPDVTLEDSINRMTAWARGMAEFRRS
jgi:hypothetical protein